jgi:hypothetical protein
VVGGCACAELVCCASTSSKIQPLLLSTKRNNGDIALCGSALRDASILRNNSSLVLPAGKVPVGGELLEGGAEVL